MPQVWKIAPGQGADDWELFRDRGCIGLGWDLPDYSRYRNEEEVLAALEEVYGKGRKGFGAGAAEIIWRFVNEVGLRQIVVANKGYNGVVGIGVVTSDYMPPSSKRNPILKNDTHRRHIRLVNWIITEPANMPGSQFFVQATLSRLGEEKFDQVLKVYAAKHPRLSQELKQLLQGSQSTDSELPQDLDEIVRRKDVDATTKETLVRARLGQGQFRTDVLRQWGDCCSVTGSKTTQAIRASHIKPWCESKDHERLDPNNGFPLVASLDALFDAGLISFASSGRMIVSANLNLSERKLLGITSQQSLRKKPTTETADYLAEHRHKHGFE